MNAKKIVAALLTAAMVVSTATAAFAAGSPAYQPKYVKTNKNDKIVVYQNNEATMSQISLKSQKLTKLILGTGKQGTVTGEDKVTKYELTSIGAYAVPKTAKAETIKLGKKVKKLNRKALSGAIKMTKLVFTNPELPTINKNAFKGLKKSQLAKVKVRVSADMKAEDFAKLKETLVSLGFTEGKILQAKAAAK